jgi:hypothetical protein
MARNAPSPKHPETPAAPQPPEAAPSLPPEGGGGGPAPALAVGVVPPLHQHVAVGSHYAGVRVQHQPTVGAVVRKRGPEPTVSASATSARLQERIAQAVTHLQLAQKEQHNVHVARALDVLHNGL